MKFYITVDCQLVVSFVFTREIYYKIIFFSYTIMRLKNS